MSEKKDQKKKGEAVIRLNEGQRRLFKRNWMERFTYTSPQQISVMYFILSGIMIYIYMTRLNPDASAFFVLKWFVIGYFSWTLGEYILHRWLYHDPVDATYDKGHHYLLHGIHHEFPDDVKRIIMPPIPSLGIAATIFTILYLAFWLITGSGYITLVFGPGFLIGYLCYKCWFAIISKQTFSLPFLPCQYIHATRQRISSRTAEAHHLTDMPEGISHRPVDLVPERKLGFIVSTLKNDFEIF